MRDKRVNTESRIKPNNDSAQPLPSAFEADEKKKPKHTRRFDFVSTGESHIGTLPLIRPGHFSGRISYVRDYSRLRMFRKHPAAAAACNSIRPTRDNLFVAAAYAHISS